MSIPAVIRDIELVGQQLFDHAPLVRAEIDRFIDRFERNERHREFDGILRASHALVEAAETPVEALFDTGKMKTMTADINALTERIKGLTEPKHAKEHEAYLNEVQEGQRQYLELCRTEAQKKMRGSIHQ